MVPGVELISLDHPRETRRFPYARIEVVTVGGSTVGRMTFEPGWRCSTSVEPIVGTERCQGHHLGFAISGRLWVVDAAGVEAQIGPGQACDIARGHDARVIGDETFVGFELMSAAQYAKPG